MLHTFLVITADHLYFHFSKISVLFNTWHQHILFPDILCHRFELRKFVSYNWQINIILYYVAWNLNLIWDKLFYLWFCLRPGIPWRCWSYTVFHKSEQKRLNYSLKIINYIFGKIANSNSYFARVLFKKNFKQALNFKH